MSPTRIMVTGAGGYIGSVSTYLFLQNGFEVVAVDNFSTGFRKPLELLQERFGRERLRLYETDLKTGVDEVFQQEPGIEAVVHYAAHCMMNESMEDPQKYFTNNVGGSMNLLSTMLKHDVRNIVFSSTCAVYGEARYVPVDELHPTHPENPYGQTKHMVEQMIEWYGKLVGLNYVILRYFNVCGAADDGLIGDSKNPSVLLVQNAVRGVLGIEPFYLTCPEVDTPDGTPIKDYINVVDLNDAHLEAVNYLLGGSKSEIINLGTGTGSSVLEIVNKVAEATGFKFDLRKNTPRRGECAKMVASIGKAKEVLGWEPRRSMDDSINSLLTWYKRHPHGWGR